MEKKFIVDQKTLITILASMQPICTKRTTLNTTAMILFQVGNRELVLKSTDLEISLQASCELIDSTIGDAESFLVSGRRIFEVIKEFDGSITCILEDNQLKLLIGDVHLTLNTQDTEEFPALPERIENLMHIDADLLRAMVEKVSFLIPQNHANNALNGLLLEISSTELTMTTTDGHCLAHVTTTAYTLETPRTWLLPRRAIFELKKLLDTAQDKSIFLGVCDQQLVFSGELFNFFTKLLADPFPQYRPILDRTGFVGATLDRSRCMKTLRRSACLLSGQFLATQFMFTDNNVRVSMHNKDVGKLDETLAVEGLEAQAIDTRFYAPYLLNGLQVLTDDTLQFYLRNSAKPIIFESKKDKLNMTYLVMPVSHAQAHQ
jgi:DNA polymerase III, beta subunit